MVKTVEERQTRYEEQIEQRLARLVEFAAANHDNQHRRTTEDLRKAFSPAKPVPATSRQPKGRQTRLHHYFNTRTSKESPLWHIPTDILLEIASHLTHPLDLLHYSWTSTVARGTLMSRRHRSIWQVVLRRVPDLPPRPEDLSEPLYTALVFGQHCFACGCGDAYAVDYALRLRLCDKCYDVNVSDIPELLKDVPDAVRDVVLMLSPAEEPGYTFAYSRLNPLYIIAQDRFFKPEISAVVQCLWPTPSLDDVLAMKTMLRIRVEEVLQRKIHAVLRDGKELALRAYLREAQSLTKFKKYLIPPIPWDPLDDDEDDRQERYQRYGNVPDGSVSLAPEWMSLTMKPLEQLDAENHSHESREEVAFYVRVKARYVEIEYWYERLFASHDIGDFERDMLPDTYDGARLWASLAAGDINNARRSIDSIFPFGSTDEILGHLKKYKEEVQQSLAALVPKQVAKALLPATVPKRRGNQQKQECPGDMLERASVFFSCTSCGERALPWSKVNVHWHERHPDIHFFDDGGWPRKKLHVRFWEEGHQTVQKILAVLRFGSQTSAAHLDSLVKSGRLYCACGDPSLELPDELIWAKLVKHLHVHLEMNYAFKNTHLMVFKGRVVTWIDDHRLQDCIKCLPLHADTSTSSHRFSADAATRTRVERHLDKIVNPVCAVCRALAADVTTPSELATIAQSCLSRNADAIVYHLKAKHGRDFREEDVTSKSS